MHCLHSSTCASIFSIRINIYFCINVFGNRMPSLVRFVCSVVRLSGVGTERPPTEQWMVFVRFRNVPGRFNIKVATTVKHTYMYVRQVTDMAFAECSLLHKSR